MADAQLKITCACGTVGLIELPYQPMSVAVFMYDHHGGPDMPGIDEVTPNTATIECQCGSSFLMDVSNVGSGIAMYAWIDKHRHCEAKMSA